MEFSLEEPCLLTETNHKDRGKRSFFFCVAKDGVPCALALKNHRYGVVFKTLPVRRYYPQPLLLRLSIKQGKGVQEKSPGQIHGDKTANVQPTWTLTFYCKNLVSLMGRTGL